MPSIFIPGPSRPRIPAHAISLPQTAPTRLVVYNALGQEVRTLVSGTMEAGLHEVDFDAAGLPGGLYFCRLRQGEHEQVRKMVLLK